MWLEIIITSKIRIFSFIICRPDSFIYVAIWQTKSIIWYDDHVLVDVCGRICLTKKMVMVAYDSVYSAATINLQDVT